MILRTDSDRATRMIIAAAIGVWSSGLSFAQDAKSAAPASQPTESKLAPPRVVDEKVDKILTRLEDRKITDLRSKVRWDVVDLVDDSKQSRYGTLFYLDREPVPKFKAHFTQSVKDGRSDTLHEEFLFDGRWWIELNSKTKTVIRRESRAEGDKRNPYKLGEGAFPLPFGQKKADILREFEVTRIEPTKDDPPATDRIRMTPIPATKLYETYRYVEFWIAAEDAKLAGLPVRVRAIKKSMTGQPNSDIILTFTDVDLTAGLSEAVFQIETPPGYETVVEPLAEQPEAAPNIKIEEMQPAE